LALPGAAMLQAAVGELTARPTRDARPVPD
jgi:hypothetical protein